jgi:Dolichyl-phosphate-mannose-protein mannosyltransferase
MPQPPESRPTKQTGPVNPLDRRRRRPAKPRHLSDLWPRPDAPLPLWMIFPVIFAALYLTHWSLLRLPYYWDEAGYYIPAAWDFFRTGSLIPITTISNAHPPLPSIYLALWWHLGGYHPAVTREAILIVAALGLLAVWKLALRLNPSPLVAFWALLLTALYPIWFAQSTLAHADIFAAAATLWALVYALPDDSRKPSSSGIWPAAIWFSLAVLAKETAIITPLTLAAFELAAGFRKTRPIRRRSYELAAWYSVCLLPLAAWYAYHYAKTGFLFGNPEFLRYNATSTLEPLRILAAFGHRILHLTGHMNMFVPTLCTAAAMVLDPIKNQAGETPPRISLPAQTRIYAILLANALAFSVLGGALLTRYLLPMYPLVLLIAVSTFNRRVRYWQLLTAFSAAAFVVALFINPPYGFAPEDNLTYAHVIRLHQQAIRQLEAHYPGSTVLTAWPVSDELTRPELGYVKTPFDVDRIEDFTAAQIDRASRNPGGYSTALVFSTKEEPPALPFHINSSSMDEQYFGLHHDLSPAAIARRLGGDIAWQAPDGLQWAAVLRFPRAVEAQLQPHPNP